MKNPAMRKMLFQILCLVTVSCQLYPVCVLAQETRTTAAPLNPAQTREVVRWLGSHAIPLRSLQAGAGFDDLQPLHSVLRDARVVGLGEATHGTHEFFQFKHRMLEFLVTQMGFRVFAIEASYAACLKINNYVLHGEGNPAEALAGLKFWTWDTHEVADMIAWMRAYNIGVPDSQRVQFLGFDIQHNEHGYEVISAYLKKVAPSYVPTAEADFASLPVTDRQVLAFSARSEQQKAKDMENLKNLVAFLDARKKDFVRQTSMAEFEQVRQLAHVLVQFDDASSSPLYNSKDPEQSATAKRDRYMAENIQYLLHLQGPQTRMIVWAHNAHIATVDGMGRLLRQAFGQAYYAFGFTFYQGSFQSLEFIGQKLDSHMKTGGLREFTVGPAPAGSVGWYFEQAREGQPFHNYMVDFRCAPKRGPVAQWLASPHPMFEAGSIYKSAWASEPSGLAILGKEFDGMIFIEKTTRAQPNPTGMRGPMPNEK